MPLVKGLPINASRGGLPMPLMEDASRGPWTTFENGHFCGLSVVP